MPSDWNFDFQREQHVGKVCQIIAYIKTLMRYSHEVFIHSFDGKKGKMGQFLDCFKTHKDVIERTGIEEHIGKRAFIEIFEVNYEPLFFFIDQYLLT